jgi:hypothetical protein
VRALSKVAITIFIGAVLAFATVANLGDRRRLSSDARSSERIEVRFVSDDVEVAKW